MCSNEGNVAGIAPAHQLKLRTPEVQDERSGTMTTRKRLMVMAASLAVALGGYAFYASESHALWWLAFLAIKY